MKHSLQSSGDIILFQLDSLVNLFLFLFFCFPERRKRTGVGDRKRWDYGLLIHGSIRD